MMWRPMPERIPDSLGIHLAAQRRRVGLTDGRVVTLVGWRPQRGGARVERADGTRWTVPVAQVVTYEADDEGGTL